TDGDLSYNPATDVYWDNPVDGRSNKIIYKWSGTHGTVRVNINTNSIIAYGGGGQQLDFDRKTPNGEANAYYVFSVGYSNSNVVDFIASQYEILENTSIQFTNQSTVYNPISYFWDFGDGATSTQENPSHTYTNQGIYDVTLRINTPENEFYETKNALITVLTECSGNLYASYEFITDKKVNFHASYTGAYEPLVNEYRFTIYFGDGTYQSEQGILNMENFEKTYSDFGDYYPVVIVETIDQFGDIICLKEYEMGLLQISNPDPCSDFEVDFTISPPIAYNGIYGNSDVTVNFYNTTTGASNNCTWRWDFLSDIENGFEPVGGISTELISSGNGNPQPKQYNHEGFYPVWLTATDWNTSCSESVSKLVTVANPISCVNSLKIYSYGSEQLWNSNRLVIPWQQDGNSCNISLYNNYNYYSCLGCGCDDNCGDKKQVNRWYINEEKVVDREIYDSRISWGGIVQTEIQIESSHLLIPYRNSISCVIEGSQNVVNNTVSCYDSTAIEVLAVNCDGFMNSSAFNYAYTSLISFFIPSFTLNGYAIQKQDAIEFYSGKMNLSESVNPIINSQDVTLYACNGIYLMDGFKTGDKSFVAKGSDGIEGCTPFSDNYSIQIVDSLSEFDAKSVSVSVIPNPVSKIFKVLVNHIYYEDFIIELFDTNGRILKKLEFSDMEPNYYEILITDLEVQPGTYYCRYMSGKSIASCKFIKQHKYEK
ncbi:MAG TPA: PKD domain-containing protein, partial [Bacteroidales bacterium]|nr:PKD domain-containing protein [Bacteroidales bacterium]